MKGKAKYSIVPCIIAVLLLAGCVLDLVSNNESLTTISPTSSAKKIEPTFEITPTPMRDLYLSAEAQERLHMLLSTNGGCDLPCFWGILPGETTFDYAEAFFSSFHAVIKIPPEYWDGSFPTYSVPLQFIDSRNRPMDLSVNITTDNEEVRRLDLYAAAKSGEDFSSSWSSYSLRSIFSQLGVPDQITINLSIQGVEYSPGYSLLIVYQKARTAIWLAGERYSENVICPDIEGYREIDYMRMSIADPESGLDIFPRDWEYWRYGQREDIL